MGNLVGILPELLARIVCPKCRASLTATFAADLPVSLRCTGCGNEYPIEDGIPILLQERATQNGSAARESGGESGSE